MNCASSFIVEIIVARSNEVFNRRLLFAGP